MGRFHRHEDGTAHSHDGEDVHAHGADHSGYLTGAERVEVLERIFGENDKTAAANRAEFAARGVRAVNVMSAPGAGKTMLLRQIVPDTLVYCWTLISEETPLAGSRIVVESVPARIRCRSCEHTADLGDLPSFACAACGGIDVEIVAGEEFLITSLELADEGAGS